MSTEIDTKSHLSDLYGDNFDVLAVAEVNDIVYAAVKNLYTGNVTATINVIRPDGLDIGWDEYENPAHASAPASILDLLTDDQFASAEWRERCRKNLEV